MDLETLTELLVEYDYILSLLIVPLYQVGVFICICNHTANSN